MRSIRGGRGAEYGSAALSMKGIDARQREKQEARPGGIATSTELVQRGKKKKAKTR